MKYIVDLSQFNTVTDWSAAKKDIEFAIIRIGYRSSVPGKSIYGKIAYDDKYFSYLDDVQKYNIPYTVYFFTTAITDQEAAEEANWIKEKTERLNLNYPIFIDTENVMKGQKGRADSLSKDKRTHLIRVLTDRLTSYGIPCGVYSYTSWLTNNVDLTKMEKVVQANTWVAQNPKLTYKGTATLWQYGTKKFSWSSAPIDVNKQLRDFDMSIKKEQDIKKTEKAEDNKMAYYRSVIVEKAKSYLGTTTGSAKHKEIINKYNSQKSLARGYKMTLKDPWCATFVSSVAVMCGYTAIIPTECSCGFMVDLAKKMGIWQQKDNYVPKPGDILMYDWDDNGKGDDTGWPDHTGFVETVGKDSFTTIEGNSTSAAKVARQTVKINQAKIRGFICPKYTADKPTENKSNTTVKKVQLTINLPEIHPGDKGEHVKFWQWLTGAEQTGILDGPTTKAWQKANGKTQDSWVGKGCWTKALQKKGWM